MAPRFSLAKLQKRWQFVLVAKKGRYKVGPLCTVQLLPAPPTFPRLAPFHVGFTASKKVGNAVKRNRAKRRLRAAIQHLGPTLSLLVPPLTPTTPHNGSSGHPHSGSPQQNVPGEGPGAIHGSYNAFWCVIIAKSGTADAPFGDLCQSIEGQLRHLLGAYNALKKSPS